MTPDSETDLHEITNPVASHLHRITNLNCLIQKVILHRMTGNGACPGALKEHQ